MRVGVIGQGYVGLTIAVSAAKAGHKVTGIDLSEELVNNISACKSHIEGISNSDLELITSRENYSITTEFDSIADCDVVVIAVPTPLTDSGAPDLNPLELASTSASRVLKTSTLIINESTSYPGTLREVIKPIFDSAGNAKHLFAVSPERVDPGNAKFGTMNTPRLVGGLTEEARDRAVDFYSTFCNEVVPVSSAEVAEAAKLLENSFRFINISFINEFSKIMQELGIPVNEVINAAGTKPYGFMKFTPTVGIGGHCIPVDPIYLQSLAQKIGLPSEFIGLSQKVNDEMPAYAARLLNERSGGLLGKKILILGVSYKPDVADTRETSAKSFIEELTKLGALVSWHDPLVKSWNSQLSSTVSGDYDLGFVLAEHNSLDLSGWNGRPIYCLIGSPRNPEWISLLGSNR